MLSYSISLLAAHPEVQEWVAEEVHYVLQGQGTSETWEYSLFPRLKRCLTVMLETLRLYPSVGSIPKYTNDRAQSLNINGEVHIIPPKTLVFLNSFAMHKMPRYWGSDSLVWRPSRWILPSCPGTVSNGASLSSGIIFDKETLLEPKKGTFMPWSDGPRVCPGKKFAQVEFVAVLSTLLRNHRVRPVARDGEKEEDAQQRILDVVADSGIHFTLQMRHPTRVTVSWVSV
ncbi:hypothetical protein LPUS_08801 [Lasallia pustulata]|nr:hypothetical protein LPUS_08801 [Lasallia pustulata]